MKRIRKHPAKSTSFYLIPELKAALLSTALAFLLPLTLLLGAEPEASPPTMPPTDTAHYIRAGESADESGDTSAPAEESEPVEEEPEPEQEAPKQEKQKETTVKKEEKKSAKKAPDTIDGGVELTVLIDGKPQKMTLDEYLWGVVAAEMPAAFDQQALCAQAVAARTYTLYRLDSPNKNHPDVDICGDSTCCQAWMSRKDRLADWSKKDGKTYEKKITKAVKDTDGLALYYDGAPILAAFHAASAGSTKSALEVWGKDYPYLQEVSSPEDDSLVPNYYSTVTVKKDEFAEAFTKKYPKADLSDPDCSKWFGKVEKDEAGLPVFITVGGVRADTGDVRSLFSLRSASFSIECEGEDITFYVTGYGHGVGMSQYGSNALARQGMDFREILDWYYHGAELRALGS